MNWFKKKYTVCATCRVHFEPYPDYQDYLNLCSAHREAQLKLQHRIKYVMSWARENWATLEPQALEAASKNTQYAPGQPGFASPFGVVEGGSGGGMKGEVSVGGGVEYREYS